MRSRNALRTRRTGLMLGRSLPVRSGTTRCAVAGTGGPGYPIVLQFRWEALWFIE